MDAIENAKAYLILAEQELDTLYNSELSPDPDNPSEAIAEVENAVYVALEKLDNLK